MAKPKITTYTVTGSGAIINTGEAVAANYIELNGSSGNTFVLQADTLKSAITLKGNNTIYVEGNLADYQFSQKAKTVTMIDGDHTYSFTLSTMTSKSVVTTTMVFLDGQITMSNANKTNKVSLRGLDDDGAALNQELTKTPTDVKINADSTNTTAATFFSDETKAADAAEAAAILDVQNTAYANAVVEVYQAAHKEAEKAQEQAIEADNNYQAAAAAVIDNQTASVAEALAEISLAAAARYEVAAAQEKEAAVELTAAAAVTTSTVDNAVAALANLLADAAVFESGVYVEAAIADQATAEQVILDVAEQTGYEEDFALDAVVMDYAYDATVAAQEDALAAEADYDVAEADVTDIASAQVAVAFAHISDEAADRNVAAATAEQWAAQELTASAALTGNVVDIKAAAIATYVANENAAAAAAIKVDTLQQIIDADQLLLDVTEQTGYEEEFALAGEIMKGAYAETVRAQEDALAAEADYDVAEAAVTCITSANVAVALAHIADEAADRYLNAAIQEQVVAQALTDAAEATGIDVFIEAAAIATQVADQAVEAAEAIKVDTVQQIVDADQILVDVTIQEGYEADFAVDVELNKYAFAAAEKAQDEAKTAEANYDVGEAAVTDISSAQIAVALAHIADESADNFVAAAAQEQAAAALLTASAALTGNAEYIKGAAVATYAANLNVTAAAAIKVDTLQQIVDADQILVEATALTAAEQVEYFAELTAAHALTAYDHAEDETHEVLMVAEQLNLDYEYVQPAVDDSVSAAQAKVLADFALEAANVWVEHATEETAAAAALKLATLATDDPTDDAAADAAVADALADTAEAAANLVVATANEAQAVADVALYPAPVVPYTLTLNADNLVGTSANNTFSGSVGTFQSWDTIDGGTGTNTLNVELSSSSVAATIANIQVFNAQDIPVAGSINTVDFQGLSSLTATNLYGSGVGSGYTLNNLGSVANVSLTTTAAASTLNFTAAALAATGQTLNLTLNSVTGGALTLSDTGSNALETVTLTSASSANTLGGLTTSGLGVTTLNIAGSQNLTLGAITDTNSTLKTVNASTATGNVSLTAIASSTVTGGTGNDTLTSGGGNLNSFTGGAGTNTFNFDAGLASTNTIAGGAGTDTLRATSAQLTAFTTAAPATNISGIESLTLSTALGAGALVLSAIQAGINDVNVGTIAIEAASTGTITFDSGVAGNIDVGTSALASTLGNFTVVSAGTGIADSVYIDNDTAASNIFAGSVTATGVETLTLDGTTTTTAVAQGLGAVAGTISLTASLGGTTTLNLVGNNSFVPGAVITAGTINASGLTTNLNGVASFLTMIAGANTATTIIGGAGADTLHDNNAATTATSIDGGAGNDTITTTGVQNDTLLGGNGDDTITGATGNDSIDGGAGDDAVVVASGDITSADTISGGTGTADVLAYSSFVAATDNVVAAQQQVSNFEVLSLSGAVTAANAVTLTNYINNTGFTNINLDAQATTADGFSFANASSILNTISVSSAAASILIGTHVFDRLVDTATDALTIGNASTGTGFAQVMTAFTALDEETITLTAVAGTTAGANDLTISTLTVADLATLNISSASDVIITAAIAGATNLATVNASTSTGAVTVNASNTGTAVTMTANSSSTAVNTFTGGAFADVITGGSGNDVLVSNGGNDTISGGAGTDAITGGTGADNMTGGTGVDTFNQSSLTDSVLASATAFAGANVAAGDTLTFGNGVDVITDFTAGAGGDVINALVAGLPTTLIGETVASLTLGNETFFASGTYAASTGLFTIKADGSGADTLIVQADNGTASDSLLTNSSYIVLVGVDSDNLVAANIA